MTEADIEIIMERAKEKYPEARPRIISDNGPQFIAKDFKEFIRLCGMTHVRTSPFESSVRLDFLSASRTETSSDGTITETRMTPSRSAAVDGGRYVDQYNRCAYTPRLNI